MLFFSIDARFAATDVEMADMKCMSTPEKILYFWKVLTPSRDFLGLK